MQGKHFLFLLLQLSTLWLSSYHAASLASKPGIKDGLTTGHEEISWDEERHRSPDENVIASGSNGIRGFGKFSPFPYESNAFSGKREASPNDYIPPFVFKEGKKK